MICLIHLGTPLVRYVTTLPSTESLLLAGWQLVPRTNSGERGNARLNESYERHRSGSKWICRNCDFPKFVVPFLHLFCDMKVRMLLVSIVQLKQIADVALVENGHCPFKAKTGLRFESGIRIKALAKTRRYCPKKGRLWREKQD